MSPPPNPTPTAFPFLLRMVRMEQNWGDDTRAEDERTENALTAEFQVRHEAGADAHEISLFEVADDAEFRRCVIALCAGRDSPPGTKFLFVPVSAATVVASVLTLTPSPGTTRCRLVNDRHHWDARGTVSQLREFYRAQYEFTPEPQRVRKDELRQMQATTASEGCTAATAIAPCRVPACPPATPIPTGSPSIPPAPSI